MGGIRLWAAATLLLAACGPGEKVADSAVNGSLPAPATEPQPRPAPPPPEAAKTESIPAAFHGRYDASPQDCGRPGDGRLTVTASELRFHESVGSVRGVVSRPAGGIRVEADYQGEGERWSNSHDLRLSEDGSKLTVSGDGTSFDRVRCPAGAP
jgi:hypothetical protein